MPRFFFDILDGGLVVDDEGTEFPNAHAASAVALKTLTEIARDEIGSGSSREVSVVMRNDAGVAVFEASIKLSATWLIDVA